MKSVPIFLNGEWRKAEVPFGKDGDDEVEDEGQSGNEGEGATNEKMMDRSTDQVAGTSAASGVDAEVHSLSSLFFSSLLSHRPLRP